MPKQLYDYTLYKADGSIQASAPRERMNLDELQESVGGLIEIIPNFYYRDKKFGKVTVYGYEEARIDGLPRNPHFTVQTDVNGEEWDVVGDVLVEKAHKRTEGKPDGN